MQNIASTLYTDAGAGKAERRRNATACKFPSHVLFETSRLRNAPAAASRPPHVGVSSEYSNFLKYITTSRNAPKVS